MVLGRASSFGDCSDVELKCSLWVHMHGVGKEPADSHHLRIASVLRSGPRPSLIRTFAAQFNVRPAIDRIIVPIARCN